MVASTVVAHLNTVAISQRDEDFDPPISRVITHLLQLFVGDSHMVIVLDVILHVKLIKEKIMRRFLVIIEPTDTGFSAYSPDISGCVATGTDLVRKLL